MEEQAIFRHTKKTIWELSLKEPVTGLLKRLRQHDPYTYGHSIRVAHYCLELTQKMGLPEAEQDRIARSVLLHDIGKLRIGSEILCKKEKLNPHEWEQLKNHPQYSLEIAEESMETGSIDREVILYHHENLDGTGYPFGLTGRELSLAVRMIRVTDSFDAMTSVRSYNRQRAVGEVFGELHRLAGTHYDADLVQMFHQYMRETGLHDDRILHLTMEIQLRQSQLMELGLEKDHDFADENMLVKSQEVDSLLVQYYRLLKENREKQV